MDKLKTYKRKTLMYLETGVKLWKKLDHKEV